MKQPQARCWAVLPAAGIGSRMGQELPKQYLEIAGATILEHSLRALLACEQLNAVVVALHPRDSLAAGVELLADSRVQRVIGGDQRSDSVQAGLDALAGQATADDWVLVHDAARPCLQPEDVNRLIERVLGSGTGGILAEPIVDTVKLAGENALVARTLDREALWRAQTPQMFRLGELREAFARAARQGQPLSDESCAMEMAGYPVQLVPGSPSNLKVTRPADLEIAAWYLAGQAET